MVDEVIYLQKAKSLEKQDKVNVLEGVFENSWKNYQDASRRLEHYGSQGILAKQALSILESTYATQGVSFEEILRMERKVLSYQLAQIKAISDQQASVAFMYYLMGNN
jgi:outer membrane protein TolC